MPFRPVPPVHKSHRARPREGFRWPPDIRVPGPCPTRPSGIVPIPLLETQDPAFQNDTVDRWIPPAQPGFPGSFPKWEGADGSGLPGPGAFEASFPSGLPRDKGAGIRPPVS